MKRPNILHRKPTEHCIQPGRVTSQVTKRARKELAPLRSGNMFELRHRGERNCQSEFKGSTLRPSNYGWGLVLTSALRSLRATTSAAKKSAISRR